ncbi:hypothetical protein M885DRAFT_67692 [Pelagophyceae sp. CCMP2097]|nr:hypothetical protein M885DRAFT_67692 [Pelagophyceae sp. CCMP2097]
MLRRALSRPALRACVAQPPRWRRSAWAYLSTTDGTMDGSDKAGARLAQPHHGGAPPRLDGSDLVTSGAAEGLSEGFTYAPGLSSRPREGFIRDLDYVSRKRARRDPKVEKEKLKWEAKEAKRRDLAGLKVVSSDAEYKASLEPLKFVARKRVARKLSKRQRKSAERLIRAQAKNLARKAKKEAMKDPDYVEPKRPNTCPPADRGCSSDYFSKKEQFPQVLDVRKFKRASAGSVSTAPEMENP